MIDDVLIILRCLNDAWVIRETLEAVFSQKGVRFKVVAIDSGSTDGSVDVLRAFPLQLIEIPPGSYVPGRVLNMGMQQGAGPYAAFVNSDCTPQNDEWLRLLIEPLAADPGAAACYGQQIARPNAHPLVVKDYSRAFGDGTVAASWRHFFSMASSAIRREVWQKSPFDEAIRYSEDVYWTWQRKQEGFRILYARDSLAMHSHNYTLPEMRRRFAGEGRADAAIYPRTTLQPGLVNGLLRPWMAEAARDASWCLRKGEWKALLESPVHRWVQRSCYRRGLREGLGLA